MGSRENSGRDGGMEEPYWGPSIKFWRFCGASFTSDRERVSFEITFCIPKDKSLAEPWWVDWASFTTNPKLIITGLQTFWPQNLECSQTIQFHWGSCICQSRGRFNQAAGCEDQTKLMLPMTVMSDQRCAKTCLNNSKQITVWKASSRKALISENLSISNSSNSSNTEMISHSFDSLWHRQTFGKSSLSHILLAILLNHLSSHVARTLTATFYSGFKVKLWMATTFKSARAFDKVSMSVTLIL